MAPEDGDPIDGGSPPNAPHPTEDGSFEDLLGTEPPLDYPDLPMADLGDESSMSTPSHERNPGAETGPQSEDGNLMDWPNVDNLPRMSNSEAVNGGMAKTGEQDLNGEVDLTESDRIRSLLTSDTANPDDDVAPSDIAHPSKGLGQSSKDKEVAIKQESPEFQEIMSRSFPIEVIDLCDTEDVVIKKECADEPFNWASMADETISISDSDDEYQRVVSEDETLTPASLLNARQKSRLMNVCGDDIVELGSENEQDGARVPRLSTSLLGKKISSRAKHTSEDIAKQRQRQRLFHERMLSRSGKSGPAVLFKGPDGSRRPGLDTNALDDDSWMSSDTNFDEEAAIKFRELKRRYKAKTKADANTVEDDYDFQRAEKAEKARLKRLELEYLASRGPPSDEDESDEDGLFVRLSPPQGAKRRIVSDNDEESNTQGQKKRRQNQPPKQASNNPDKELEMNLMAGMDGYFLKERREASKLKDKEKSKKGGKARKEASNAETPGKAQSNSSSKKTWAKKDKAPRRKRPTQAGYLNNAASLLNSNVFEDADANRDLAPLPISTEKNKAKALAAMVANMPLGDRRRSEKEHIRRATVTLGKQKVSAAGDGGWKFTGIESSLRHHQVQGAAWMKERELGDSEPLGGILADGMGLGKTVMAVTLALANRPTRNDKYKATLIVCTPALLNQWENEIGKHVTKGVFRRVMKYHAGCRTAGLGAIDDIQNADIVLTTYHEVMRSYPKTDVPEDIDDFAKLQAWWKNIWEEDRDVLHKARFFRVILDESQAIKNHLSQTSISCRALMAKHRWALSGTPIMNRVEELYPYFKFLRVECTGSYHEFTQHFCIEGSTDCNKRLHCMLDQIMIRRTMKDKVLGHPIVSLPTTHQGTERLEFNIVERLIYKIVSRRFIRAINKASAKGELEKKPGYGIVMFLRLRQMAAHTFLIQEILQEMFNLDSVDRLEAAAIIEETEGNKPARDIVAALRRMVTAKGQPVESTPDRQSADLDTGAPSEIVINFGQRLRSLKESSKLEELKNEQLCHKCKNVPEDPWVTSCLHVYCKECLEFLAYAASKKDQGRTPCLECGTQLTSSKPCSGLKELMIDDFPDLSPDLRGRKPKGGMVNMHWVAYDDELVLSAKTIGVENQIKTWLEQDPDKKIIVFSQFLMIMAIFERVCQKNGWEYCNYNGKMSHQARDKAIAAFGKENSKIKVMIASLKCGGIGLNLTMASRVTCVDLWFNSCIEQQAFCRVWRIGQENETFVTRFIVNDTVDDRLDSMQKHKEKIIGGALDDRSITSKLSVPEVMRLFGEVVVNKKTKKPFIVMDDDEKLDAILPPLADDEDDHIAWRK